MNFGWMSTKILGGDISGQANSKCPDPGEKEQEKDPCAAGNCGGREERVCKRESTVSKAQL